MIRFTIDGTEYSVDTPQEAADLKRLLSRQRAGQKAAATRWSASKSGRAKKVSILPEINKLFLALYDANNRGATADKLAETLGVKLTAIPPLFAHARSWVRMVSQAPYETLITKGESMSGVTIFQLTEEGRALVAHLKEQRGELF